MIPMLPSFKRRLLLAGAGCLAMIAAIPLLAKHASNPGPDDAPIRFKLPPPQVLSAQEAIKTFKLQDGFQIEVVAAEPMVEDPIAISFDAEGRMWVVEMRGYMHDIDGAGEDQPIGRIKILEDTDGDGKMDKATVFLDKLLMPRSVLPVRGGALVAEPPNLVFWRDSKGDGKADQQTVVATDYGVRGGQPEHMANGLTYDLDNWIYSANYTNRFRFQGGKWVAEPTRSRGQWGLSQDDFGRLYCNYNSDLLHADFFPSQYLNRNPYFRSDAGQNVRMMSDGQVWPSHPTPGTNRGYTPKELRDDGTLRSVTATCGPSVYRGDLFPPEFRGNVFIPEPAGNLIKRVLITDSDGQLAARNAYENVDFLTSADERFRPVNTCTGPDGALYVVDMYRGILQHKAYLTNYLIKNIKERKLDTPFNMGRIYRITPAGSHPKAVKLPKEPAALVEYLTHANGWVRDTAQRLLVERHDAATSSAIAQIAHAGPTPAARVQALWTLDGMLQLDPPVVAQALEDPDPKVRVAALRLSEPLLVPALKTQTLPGVLKLVADPSAEVRLQLALSLSAVTDPAAEDAIATLLATSGPVGVLIRDAAISGMRGRETQFLEALMKRPGWSDHSSIRASALSGLAQCILAEHHTANVKRLLDRAAAEPAGSWRQVALLRGATGSSATLPRKGDLPPPVKMIYLDGRPESLATLVASKQPEVKALAAKLDERLAWPGKPGVPPPPVIRPLTADEQARFNKGKVSFSQICAVCHQPTGLGQDGLAPPLVDSEWVLGPAARTIRIVLHGLSGNVAVEGTQYRLEMPALGTLADEDIANILTYVRREWEHAADPVTIDLVKQVRSETSARNEAWNANELLGVK